MAFGSNEIRTSRAAVASTRGQPEVIVMTEVGDFSVCINEVCAPASAADFLGYVDGGLMANTSIYRILAPTNRGSSPSCLVQFGVWPLDPARRPLPMIAHEPTGTTGLRHIRGTLSHARLEPGTAGGAWFVCLVDMPHYDEHAGQGDGLGYAAFGRVSSGIEVLDRILQRAEPQPVLSRPIAILKAERVSIAHSGDLE